MIDEETFKQIKEEAMQVVIEKVLGKNATKEKKVALKTYFEEMLNQVMLSEREVFLENSQEENKANGFYERNLASGSSLLELKVPRDRKSSFRPFVLPAHYKRTDSQYEELLVSLVTNGFSEAKLINSLKQLGLPYSQTDMDKIRQDLEERLNDIKTKELPSDMFVVYIDAYHTQVRDKNKVRKSAVYIIVGIDLKANKQILGFYLFFGNENKADWSSVLNDLINRGLKRILIIVSDDFSGLADAINALYPKTEHQLCFIHLQRNVRKNIGRADSKEFNSQLSAIRHCIDFEDGMDKFTALTDKYMNKYPHFIKLLKRKQENYLNFLRYPKDIRKYLYTTNAVESINSLIEKIRIGLGGYFQSASILEINIMIQIERLNATKWQKPHIILRSYDYELNQYFNLKFFNTPLFTDVLSQTQVS